MPHDFKQGDWVRVLRKVPDYEEGPGGEHWGAWWNDDRPGVDMDSTIGRVYKIVEAITDPTRIRLGTQQGGAMMDFFYPYWVLEHAFRFRAGDMVRVTNYVDTRADCPITGKAWQNSWAERMTEYVGRVWMVVEDFDIDRMHYLTGVRLDGPADCEFPWWVLEKVSSAATPTAPAGPTFTEDMTPRERLCAAQQFYEPNSTIRSANWVRRNWPAYPTRTPIDYEAALKAQVIGHSDNEGYLQHFHRWMLQAEARTSVQSAILTALTQHDQVVFFESGWDEARLAYTVRGYRCGEGRDDVSTYGFFWE